jgi:hypothetical protein
MPILDALTPEMLWEAGLAAPVLALLAIVHAVRTGRPWFWVWVVLFFPVVGALAYFLAEVLPYSGGLHVHNPIPALLDALIPGRELKRLEENLAYSNTVANRQALAAYHLRKGAYAEALRLTESCLSGVYKDDPALKLELAGIHLLAGQPKEARKLLSELAAAAPQHEARVRDQLLARAAEELGDARTAYAIYDQLRASGPMSEESRVRFARLLEGRGDRQRAREIYADVVRRLSRASNHYRRQQRSWLLEARKGLKQLEA